MTSARERAGAFLTIDVAAAVANWRLLRDRLGRAECGAVVKADAYGLGPERIAPALEAAGCRAFFVADLDEAIALRNWLKPAFRIFVLNGTPPGCAADFLAHDLTPVVNTMAELAAWRAHARKLGRHLPIAPQLDIGMARLGLEPAHAEAIAADPTLLDGLESVLTVGHLACPDDPGHPANAAQLAAFERLRALLPSAPASLASSSGIFLDPRYHFDLARPGVALYGINPTPGMANPMWPVVSLTARVLQLRDVPAGAGVGYGQTATTTRPSRLATIALGYADGWPRSAAAAAWFGGEKLPFIGRVSMDSIVVDATDLAATLHEGDRVELIGPHQSVDDVAQAAGTIGYEILTSLGRRLHRAYVGEASPPEA
jgi:alanine racemase